MTVLTREDVARLLQLSLRQVDRLIADGRLSAFRVGTAVRVRQEALEEFMRASVPISLEDAALLLALEPASLRQLVASNAVPHQRRGSDVVFDQHELERWVRNLHAAPITFGDMDSAARHLQADLLTAGHAVELLHCELCLDEVRSGARPSASVAGRRCHLCGRASCLPHSMHWLPGPLHRKPDVVCDGCFDKFQPATMAASKPRRFRIPGHTTHGDCGLCGLGCPRPCSRPGCGGTIHASDGSPHGDEVSHGPHCDTCGLGDVG